MATMYPWAHEKKLRLRREDFDPTWIEPYRSRKHPKYCKKLKGKHIFKLFKEEYFRWIKEWIIEFRCIGCNKKRLI